MIENLIIAIMMKLKMISKIEERLMKNQSYRISKLKEKHFKKFFTWYLEQDYNLKSIYPFAIFSILSIAITKLGSKQIDEMSIDSKMLNTIPEEKIYSFFNINDCLHILDLSNLPLLSTFLTSRLKNDDYLISLLNKSAKFDVDYAYRKLIEGKDIATLISYDDKFLHKMDSTNLASHIVDSNNYTIEELKQYFISSNTSTHAIIDSFAKLYNNAKNDEEKGQTLTALLEIIVAQYQQNQDDEEVNTTYHQYAYIINHNHMWTKDMKNQLAEKLLETQNYEFIYYWFICDIECDYNYNIIDTMSEENATICARLLASVNDSYIDYTYTKISSFGKEKISEVIEELCSELEYIAVDRIDKILDIHYYKDYHFKLSKESALALINSGSKYTPKFIDEYEFNEEERRNILANNKDFSFLVIYETYLQTGDRKDLPSRSQSEKLFYKYCLKRKK